ncbi:acyltransferase family protein [Arthrobacter oryzae]|uniref:acyltransferase family protein n=1 Tax=Arthrobacter oryzae TaxID=409290 RepID=UPI0030C93CBA
MVSTPLPGQHLKWMDTLRAVAVFMVIFEHAILLTPLALPEWLVDASNVFAPFRIPALMFLSGLLLPKSLAKPAGTYLRGKLSRIVWPYLIWSVLIWALANWGDDRPNLLIELFLNPTTTPMWFLAYLAMYYVIGLFLHGLPGALAAIPLLLVSALLGENNAGRFFYLLAFFLMGDYISRNAARFFPILFRREVTIVAGAVGIGLAVAAVSGVDVKYVPALALPVFVSILATIPLVDRLARTKPGEVIGAYGTHTIVFYVLHWPAMVYAWNLLAVLGVTNAMVLAVGNLLIGLAAGFIALVLVRKFPVLALLFSADWRRSPVSAGTASERGDTSD